MCMWRSEVNFKCLPLILQLIILTQSLPMDLDITNWLDWLASEAGQWTTRIFLSPPPQKQGYKHIQPCLTFKQGSEPKSSCFWAVKLLTEPSPQPTVLFRILELSELLDFHCEGIGAELDCSLLQQGCAPNRSFQMHWRCRFGSVCSQVPYFAFTVHPPTQYVCVYIYIIYIFGFLNFWDIFLQPKSGLLSNFPGSMSWKKLTLKIWLFGI